MKTNEFIRRVEELGFVYEKGEEVYYIYNKEGTKYASVCHDIPNQISNMERVWDFLDKEEQKKLFDLLVEYAKTPIEDREEEKKYYLKHRWLENREECNYLNFDINGLYYSLNTKPEARLSKTKFTINEIEEIKEKFNTDLADFELVEVEE